MPDINIVKKTQIDRTFRNARVQGMFDLPVKSEIEFNLKASLDLDFDWKVGLITGASGEGKTTLAKELFGVTPMPKWGQKSIVDEFPQTCSVDEIISILQGVGLSSPKTYLLPYNNLSNGQKFRADLARVIIENDFICFDEFTSVVDRNVAKAACVSVSKAVNRLGKKFVAVTCHSDVEEWLQPDWKFFTGSAKFSRDCLRRPPIQIQITKGNTSYWSGFHKHHYLDSNISPSARVFLCWAYLETWVLVGFFSVLPAMGMKGWVRGHRTVILPDFQGLGIGNKMIELVAQYLWDKEKKRFRATTSAPQIVKYRLKRPNKWRLVNGVQHKNPSANTKLKVKTSAGRLTTSWEYLPS